MQSFNKRGTALGAAIAFALTLAPTLVMAETRQIPE